VWQNFKNLNAAEKNFVSWNFLSCFYKVFSLILFSAFLCPCILCKVVQSSYDFCLLISRQVANGMLLVESCSSHALCAVLVSYLARASVAACRQSVLQEAVQYHQNRDWNFRHSRTLFTELSRFRNVDLSPSSGGAKKGAWVRNAVVCLACDVGHSSKLLSRYWRYTITEFRILGI
jgi:hypothetical protein